MEARLKNKQAIYKKLSNEFHEGQRIESTYYLSNMARWAIFCADHMTGDRYGEIAKMCGKSKALIQFGVDTRGRRDLALQILKDMAALQNDIAALMKAA